jgi:hypothetical protein
MCLVIAEAWYEDHLDLVFGVNKLGGERKAGNNVRRSWKRGDKKDYSSATHKDSTKVLVAIGFTLVLH